MAPVPQSAVSRKTHSAAGTFDIALPLSGTPGIECRSGSGTNSDSHQVIVTFAGPATVGGVTVTSANGLATASRSVNGAVVTIDLANVADGQTLSITLTNVNDGVHLGDVVIPMSVLLGDTNGSGGVSAADVAQTKSQSGAPTTAANFRTDVNVSGSVAASDVALVKANAGHTLP